MEALGGGAVSYERGTPVDEPIYIWGFKICTIHVLHLPENSLLPLAISL